jgi:hypothetical protein
MRFKAASEGRALARPAGSDHCCRQPDQLPGVPFRAATIQITAAIDPVPTSGNHL